MRDQPEPRPFSGPLFVVGMPRSGTKLLRDLLNAHPKIGIPDAESEFLPDWALRWPSFGDLSRSANWARFYALVHQSPYFTYLAEEQGRVTSAAEWRLSCERLDLQGVFEALMRHDGAVPRDGVWGDKSPTYLAHLDLLWHLWPEARVVHVVRDVRDHVLSMREAWGKDPIRAAARWADRIRTARKQARPGQWMEVRYEDLVSQTEVELRRVLDFVSLDFDPLVLQPARASENLGKAKGATGVLQASAGRWRQDLEPTLREQIERMCWDVLADTGYTVEPLGPIHRLNPLRDRALQLKDGLALWKFEAQHRGWVSAARFRWRMFQEAGGFGP